MTIGESIRYHRKRLSLTQTELAERIGVTTQAVSKWENNAGLPDITMAVPLARALGTTTDELLRFGERYQAFEDRWKEALHIPDEMYDKRLLDIALAALKEFPYDGTFNLRAAWQEMELAKSAVDSAVSQDYVGRALAHGQMHAEAEAYSETAKDFLRSLVDKTEIKDGFYVLK